MCVKLTAWAFDVPDLAVSEKLVLVYLAHRADSDGVSFPGQSTISIATGLSERQIRRVMISLAEKGILEREQRFRKNGSRTSDEYRISAVFDHRTPRPPDTMTGGQMEHSPPDAMSAPDNPTGYLDKSEEESDSCPKHDFDNWYSRYPHKVGKAAARKAFKAATKRATQAELVDGLERYIATKPTDRPWCNPATFLNQDRWLDQPAGQENQHGTDRQTHPRNKIDERIARRDEWRRRTVERLKRKYGTDGEDIADPGRLLHDEGQHE